MCELRYKVVPLIPMSNQIGEKLVWTGNNVFLSSVVSELHDDSFDPLRSELENAYRVTSSLTAEYECMESVVTTPTRAPSIGTACPISVFVPTLGKVNTSAAIDWLHDNYEEQEGISLPRGALYRHYLDHCQLTSSDPMNQASLGKVIRSIFPDVKTRRLGTRGQSKYHYYGMGIRDSSPYKDAMQTIQRINGLCSSSSIGRNFSSSSLQPLDTPPSDHWMVPDITAGTVCDDSCADSCADMCLDSCGDMSGGSGGDDGCAVSSLPSSIDNFPTLNHMNVPSSSCEKIDEFLSIYRKHCQRIVDIVTSGDFAEVRDLLVEFWSGSHAHVTTMLQRQQLIALVTLCDIHLYKTLANQLVPTILHPVSTSTQCQVRSFVSELQHWLEEALLSQPETLRSKKMLVARSFGQCVRRRIGLGNMSYVARRLLQDSNVVCKLYDDWRQLDLAVVASECCALADIDVEQHHGSIVKYLREFEKLLSETRDIELYMSWIRSMIHACVFVVSDEKKLPKHTVGRHFMLTWTFVIKVIMKDRTLISSDMFGSYHLLGMMFTDYTMYLIEQSERTHMTEHLGNIVYSGLSGLRNFASGEDTDSLLHRPAQHERKTQRKVTGRMAARRSLSEDSGSTRTTPSRARVSPSLVSLITMPANNPRMRSANRRDSNVPSFAQGSAKQAETQQTTTKQLETTVHNREPRASDVDRPNIQRCRLSGEETDVNPSSYAPRICTPPRSDGPVTHTVKAEQMNCSHHKSPHHTVPQQSLTDTDMPIQTSVNQSSIHAQPMQPVTTCLMSAPLSTQHDAAQRYTGFQPFLSVKGTNAYQPATLKAITVQQSSSQAISQGTSQTVTSACTLATKMPSNLLRWNTRDNLLHWSTSDNPTSGRK